tara:strand:+ start:150 stop:266 length:117 start_codon:yes stop_codon:yes gene_type:complete
MELYSLYQIMNLKKVFPELYQNNLYKHLKTKKQGLINE